MQNYWNECYDRQARKTFSPEKFSADFCSRCRNPECELTGFRNDNPWLHRILTQKDRLLDNPLFADPNDPMFQNVREGIRFQDAVRQAIKLEIADQKGDWSIPTESEVNRFAAKQGIKLPTSVEVKPPTDLIDEITTSPAPKDTPASPTPSRFVPDATPTSSVSMPQPPAPAPAPAPRNPNVRVGPERLNTPQPKALNTTMPAGGIMIGGHQSEAPPVVKPHDPWAAPSVPNEIKVKVGGKFVLGGSKKDK